MWLWLRCLCNEIDSMWVPLASGHKLQMQMSYSAEADMLGQFHRLRVCCPGLRLHQVLQTGCEAQIQLLMNVAMAGIRHLLLPLRVK